MHIGGRRWHRVMRSAGPERAIAELAAEAARRHHPRAAARIGLTPNHHRQLGEITPGSTPFIAGFSCSVIPADRRCPRARSRARLRAGCCAESPQRRRTVAPTPGREGDVDVTVAGRNPGSKAWHPRPPRSRPRSPRHPQARRDPDHLAGAHDLRSGRRCQAARAGASARRGVRAAARAPQRARLPTCPPSIPPRHPRAPRPPRRGHPRTNPLSGRGAPPHSDPERRTPGARDQHPHRAPRSGPCVARPAAHRRGRRISVPLLALRVRARPAARRGARDARVPRDASHLATDRG